MASARCYTKSGSVEKYESECFSGDINHYPNNFSSNMTGPDSNGNYSITYNGYDDGDSSNYDCYCETIYGDWRNGGGIKKTFYFKKKDKYDKYITYYVTFTLNSGMLNCKCDGVTNIPGTNNGNVTLGTDIQLSDGKGDGRSEYFTFSWIMKDGINESKYCSVPYYLGSGFTTRSGWEDYNGDGTKIHYTFQIDRSDIPYPPHG